MRAEGEYLALFALALLASGTPALADGTVYFSCQSAIYNAVYAYPYSSAKFGPPIGLDGASGWLFKTIPADGCKALAPNLTATEANPPKDSWIALIDRGGGCDFDEKVLNAQAAGALAVIVDDYHSSSKLIQMSGDSNGIKIPSIFIGYKSGNAIKTKLSSSCRAFVSIHPGTSLVTIRVLTVAFLSIVGMCAILSIVLVFRRARLRTVVYTHGVLTDSATLSDAFEEDETSMLFARKCGVRKFSECGKTSRPSNDGNEAESSEFCSICIEGLESQDEVICLPCNHVFHEACIHAWIYGKTSDRRTVESSCGKVFQLKKDACCPLCKRSIKKMLETVRRDVQISPRHEAVQTSAEPNTISGNVDLGSEVSVSDDDDDDDDVFEIVVEDTEATSRVDRDSETKSSGDEPETSEPDEPSEMDQLLRK